MHMLIQDLRYGLRTLLKKPGFALVAVLTLALGIGANTAIFSVVNAVLLRALPYAEADELVIVWEAQRQRNRLENVINLGNFFDWKEQNGIFEDMAAFFDTSAILTSDGEPEEVPSQIATPSLFTLLGVNPILGRTFTPDDGKPGQPRVVMLSYGLWQRRFGGDPKIISRKLILGGQETTVIGVLPANFKWHVRKGSMTKKSAELWSPWQVGEDSRQRRGRFAMAVARLKPGVTLAQAQTEMNTIGARLEQQYKEFNTNWGVNVVPLRTQFTGEIRLALLILLGAVGFLLLIACANVANLLLARAAARQKEVAVRAALGAGRWRIIRQLLTESVLLAALGGAAGLLLAWWGTGLLVSLSPPELLDLPRVEISTPVLVFTLAVSLLTGIIFGLAPAFESSRFDLHETLKEGGRGMGSAGGHRLRSVLVIAEVALALVLLIGAGLLVRSFLRLQSVDPGFNANKLLTMRVSLPGRKYGNDRKRIDFFKGAIERMQALPGVEAAGAINFMPFAQPHAGTLVEFEGRPKAPPGQGAVTGVCVTDAKYFRTMQIPLKRGRLYTEQEATEMRHVVVINEAFARKHFPNEDPLGKRVTIYMKDENLPNEIIGIVGDSKHAGLDSEIEPMSYWPHPELAYPYMNFIIRTKGDAAAMATSARSVIQALDPEQPVADVRTMESLLARSVARARFNTLLLTVFACVALLLALVGIYGVMAYAVEQRTHEIGIRMALGARGPDVLKMVVFQGLKLAVVGVAIGLLSSLLLTRLMGNMLYQVSATDPVTFTVIGLLLILIAVLACYVPARRAAKVDPMVALRYE
ncbi:MAG: ABC transporter permease [Acidobacteria bacterium]|nr:ABC transporter permease [Acidobacteriota bacterium]